MNVFIVSPGRTATTTLAEALSKLQGFTASHESRVRKLGEDRVAYPNFHIECDNRLSWFLPRLTEKYSCSEDAILVCVYRDREKVALSYNKRWPKINMMKSYSQGILMRPLSENCLDVCRDYVENVYEHIEFFSKFWSAYVEIDIDAPEKGLKDLCDLLGRADQFEEVAKYLSNTRSNENIFGVRKKISDMKFNFENLIRDVFQ